MDQRYNPLNWKFEWTTNWETINSEPFQQQWLEWYNRTANSHIFFHPALGMAWIETYRSIRDIEPLFCVAREDNITIFLPLIRWKRNWKNAFQNVIIPLGYSDFDYHDPLIKGQIESLNSYFSALVEEIREYHFFDKIDINGFRSNVYQQGWIQEPEYCPYSRLDSYKNVDVFLLSLKTSLRGDLKRQTRRMEETGDLSFFSYKVDSIDDALAVLPRFLKYHSMRWPKAYKAPGFHQRLIEYGLPLGIVDFTELRIGETPASWHLGFRDNERYYYYMPAINPDFSVFSPGKIHLLHLVKQSIDGGLLIFDHLRGDENYKEGWTNQIQKLYAYRQNGNSRLSKVKNWLIETGKDILS